MTDLFYHGTQTAIHELPEPCLDPNNADLDADGKGLDVGDPQGPHIFLTRSVFAARLFSAKSQDLIYCGYAKIGTHVIYIRKLENLDRTGYVYTIDQDRYAPFEQLEYEGVATNKWISREALNVTEYPPIFVRGLRELMQKDKVRCFYLLKDEDEIVSISDNLIRKHEHAFFFRYLCEEITSGNLGYLNAEMGITPPLSVTSNELFPTRSRRHPAAAKISEAAKNQC